MDAQDLSTRTVRFGVEVPIAAPRKEVWRTLVDETSAWWPADFHVLGEGSLVVLDAEAGGCLQESHPEGDSLVWYTVQLCRPGRALHFTGWIGPPWGGPAVTMPVWALEDGEEDGTLLRVTDHVIGHVTDELVASLQGGWEQMMGQGLKRYVEGD